MQKRIKDTFIKCFFINRLFAFYLILISSALFTACKYDHTPDPVKEQGISISIKVNPGERYQTIAGFGGANKIWGNQFLDDDVIKKVFSTDNEGLGMNNHTPLVRTRDIPNYLYLRPIPQGQMDALEMTEEEKSTYQNPDY